MQIIRNFLFYSLFQIKKSPKQICLEVKSIYIIPHIVFKTKFTTIHSTTPTTVGSNAEKTVHLRLPVSFLIVHSVVAHGK